jgi:hypothetical protein
VLVETYGPGDPNSYPKILESRTHVARQKEEDVMGELWKYLLSIRPLVSEKWEGVFPEVEDMEMTPSQLVEYEEATQCYACCGVFGEEVWRGEESYIRTKCRDHCHKTGAYRWVNYSGEGVGRLILVFQGTSLCSVQYEDG